MCIYTFLFVYMDVQWMSKSFCLEFYSNKFCTASSFLWVLPYQQLLERKKKGTICAYMLKSLLKALVSKLFYKQLTKSIKALTGTRTDIPTLLIFDIVGKESIWQNQLFINNQLA